MIFLITHIKKIRMNKYILLINLFAFLCINQIDAQVSIGTDSPPEDFSILQLDSVNGGLRLPQMEENVRDLINVNSSDLSRGLLIYNKTTDNVNYWNGTTWSSFAGASPSLTIKNGLKLSGNTVKLGGNLTQSTVLTISTNNSLNFLTGANGYFRINGNVFKINNKTVALQPPAGFALSGDLFNIAGDSITMKLSRGSIGVLTLNALSGSALQVVNENVLINGNLMYDDGNQQNGHVLVSNSEGLAYWAMLRPGNTTVKTGTLKASGTAISGSTSSETVVDITSSTLDLTPGKWLIFANYATTSSSTAANNKYYVWTYLYGKPTGTSGSGTEVSTTGTSASLNLSITNATRAALPKLLYMVDVKEPTSYSIMCSTRNLSTSIAPTNQFGASSFYAISITESGK